MPTRTNTNLCICVSKEWPEVPKPDDWQCSKEKRLYLVEAVQWCSDIFDRRILQRNASLDFGERTMQQLSELAMTAIGKAT